MKLIASAFRPCSLGRLAGRVLRRPLSSPSAPPPSCERCRPVRARRRRADPMAPRDMGNWRMPKKARRRLYDRYNASSQALTQISLAGCPSAALRLCNASKRSREEERDGSNPADQAPPSGAKPAPTCRSCRARTCGCTSPAWAAYDAEQTSRSSSAARAATSGTSTATATSTGSRRCSASTPATAATELGDAMAAPGPRARLRHHLELRASRARSSWPSAIAALAPGDLNRVFFTNSGSEAVESAIKLARNYHRLQGNGQKMKLIAREIAYHGTTLGALAATGIPDAPLAVRAAHPGRLPRAEHQQLPLARGPRPALGRRPDRGADPVRGPRDGRRRDPRAAAERRRLHPAAGGLLPAGARDLRPPRRAADLRRGDLRLGPARPLLRLRALRLPAGHHHHRQGAHLRLRADGGDDRLRRGLRALLGGHGDVRPRLHLRRPPGGGGGGDGEPRRLRARGPLRPRARARRASSAATLESLATSRSSATCAATASSTRSSWSRTRRRRRRSTTRSPRSCCAASSRASSTGAG